MTQIVHVVNQFFAGIGGEEKAEIPVGASDGAVGLVWEWRPHSEIGARSWRRFSAGIIIFTHILKKL